MSVRVIARVRPLLQAETEKDLIIGTASGDGVVKIPNPRKDNESFSFHFNRVYDRDATQSQIFEDEVAPTVKHLFRGYDVTLFAYGVTGTGKTYTMRGGKSLADRGVIPRLLSSIYRRARKVEKDSEGSTSVQVAMSYYEIYNDRVYDLFDSPDKRTPAGLPIRDTGNGKTQVVGLTERPCNTLKDFEQLYDQANVNRSTSSTKLNAHSSRSHAILCVKISQISGNAVRVSSASAIDLAGSEDNRRTENNKDRMVESASINKSLFVLAQCVEAISKKQSRIPYRESKMTRILSLGQNDGYTVMILNLAPVRSYHLDTLSSLNFANRTKKIEVNEVENQPIFRHTSKVKGDGTISTSLNAPSIHRQPLRSKIFSQSSNLPEVNTQASKPARNFSVFNDSATAASTNRPNSSQVRTSAVAVISPKRTSSEAIPGFGRPSKIFRATALTSGKPPTQVWTGMSEEAVEALIKRKVNDALAERADHSVVSNRDTIPDEVQRRLEALEKRVEGQETERAEGLQYLLMAKQHQVRGEDASALKMYQLALPHFPGNQKLVKKLANLQSKIATKRTAARTSSPESQCAADGRRHHESSECLTARSRKKLDDADESYYEDEDDAGGYQEDSDFTYRPRSKIRPPVIPKRNLDAAVAVPSQVAQENQLTAQSQADPLDAEFSTTITAQTPRTKQLLEIINTKDVSQIRTLKGVGAKKAEAIVNCLCEQEDDVRVTSLGQLGKLKGVGVRTVESMRGALLV